MDSAIGFSPAGVGNVGVGFDILGHTFAGPGDQARVRRVDAPGVRITAIGGVVADLPRDAARNTAGAGLLAMCEAMQLEHGFELELEKGIALGSGMGGSAASCVAALVAANALLKTPLTREQLYPFALQGESLASGGLNGDNVGAMLLGGLVLATADRLVRLSVPAAWHCAVVHPDAVLETLRAREVLQVTLPLAALVRQSSNLALLLTGCLHGNASLVRAGLQDTVIEPRRAPLIGGFAGVKQAALSANAMGASISGAGPSVFGWFETRDDAERGAIAMRSAFAAAGFASQAYVSPIDGPRAEVRTLSTTG